MIDSKIMIFNILLKILKSKYVFDDHSLAKKRSSGATIQIIAKAVAK